MSQIAPISSIHIHGVSVGEILSVAPLIEKLRHDMPDAPLLLTCWTETAQALAHKNYDADPMVTVERLPLDTFWNRDPFLKKHNIGLSIWIDSEIWPGWLAALKKRGIPAMIVNGRMSERSFKRWCLARFYAQRVLRLYTRIDAQSRQDAHFFNALGGKAEPQPVNLKYLRPPTPADPALLATFAVSIKGRPVVLHAMTHPGDESHAFVQHIALKQTFPDLLTINVPRHPHRAEELAAEAKSLGLKTQLRSESDSIDADTDVFFGNTIGETGLYYGLSPIAVMGKSFDPNHIGGQSPIEAAYEGCAILCGPYMTNFPAIMEDLKEAEAVTIAADMEEAEAYLVQWLAVPNAYRDQGNNAKAMIQGKLAQGPTYLASLIDFIKANRV